MQSQENQMDPGRRQTLLDQLEAIRAELEGRPAAQKKPGEVKYFFKQQRVPTVTIIRKAGDTAIINVADFDWTGTDRPASPQDEAALLAGKPADFLPPWVEKRAMSKARLKAQIAEAEAQLEALDGGDEKPAKAPRNPPVPPESLGKGKG